MKKFIAITVLYFTQIICYAQTPIQVSITGECSYVSGTYLYSGLVNNKNNYVKTFTIEGDVEVISVGYDGAKWVLYRNNELTDFGFLNLSLNGILPPTIGWSIAPPDGCLNGTMTISTTLAVNNYFEKVNDLIISPNPVNENIVVSNSDRNNSYFEYNIYDTTGRRVSSGASKFESKIGIDTLENGSYFIQIVGDNGSNSIKKFIKN